MGHCPKGGVHLPLKHGNIVLNRNQWCIIGVTVYTYILTLVGLPLSGYRCLAGHMAMHTCQIGNTDTAPLTRDRHNGCVSRQRGNALRQATFLHPFLLCYSSVWMVQLLSPFVLGLIRISGLDGKLAAGCLRSGPAWIVFCFHCLVANGKNEGIARYGIGCWVGAAMGRTCRSCAISIMRRIVRATKVDTCSHPSVLFSIIETKLPGIRGGLPIFSRESLPPPDTVEMPDT